MNKQRNYGRGVAVALALLIAATVGTAGELEADARIINPSRYRKIRNGVGNCIFSKKILHYRKESAFRTQTSFKAPDDVYVRCYFAKTMGEYTNEGRYKSSLRGMKVRGLGLHPRKYYGIRLQFEPSYWNFTRNYQWGSTRARNRDQDRIDIVKGNNPKLCEFRMTKFRRPNECVSLEKQVRSLARKQKASLPFTTRVCVYIEFDLVDKRVRNKFGIWVDVKSFRVLAKGCFKYTVK